MCLGFYLSSTRQLLFIYMCKYMPACSLTGTLPFFTGAYLLLAALWGFLLVELYQIVELGYIEAQKRKDLSKFIDEGEKDQPRFRARKALHTGFSPTDVISENLYLPGFSYFSRALPPSLLKPWGSSR